MCKFVDNLKINIIISYYMKITTNNYENEKNSI